MKKLIGLSALAIAISAAGVPVIAQAQVADPNTSSDVQYDPSAPRITGAEGYEDTHYIGVYTGARPLSYIEIVPPEGVNLEENDIQAILSDRVIRTNVSKQGNRYRISFAEPVPARTTMQLALDDVDIEPRANARIVNYRLAGKHVGLERAIPYGLARITVQ
jgi:hypothetical protein